MSSIESALRSKIKEFDQQIADLVTERKRHEQALRALNGKDRSPKPRAGARSSRAPRGRRREQTLDYLKAHAGARPSEIAKGIKASPNQVSALIRKLRSEKLVVRSGKGYKLAQGAK